MTVRDSRPFQFVIWATRRNLSGCYVKCAGDDGLSIWVPDHPGAGSGFTVEISRSEARLLARRINECLDATVKR